MECKLKENSEECIQKDTRCDQQNIERCQNSKDWNCCEYCLILCAMYVRICVVCLYLCVYVCVVYMCEHVNPVPVPLIQ